MKKLIPYITALALSFTANNMASAGSESRLNLSAEKFALKDSIERKKTKRKQITGERAEIYQDRLDNYLGCVARITNNVRTKMIAINKTPDEYLLQKGAEKKCHSLKPD